MVTQNYPKLKRRYKHYKGGTYTVLTLAKHSENDDILVIYKSLEFGSIHARPLNVWNEEITLPNKMRVDRFRLID